MIVLALDASTTAIGWALFDLDKRHPDDLLSKGIHSPGGELWDRLGYMHNWLRYRLASSFVLGPGLSYSPQVVAIETPVVYKNAKSSIKQAYAVGILGLVAHKQRIEILELRPDERLTALGLPHKLRNPKPQVVRNVNQIYSLDLDAKTQHDIADAIALGWAARRRLLQEGRLGD